MIKLDGKDIARVSYQSLFEYNETLGLLIWAETEEIYSGIIHVTTFL